MLAYFILVSDRSSDSVNQIFLVSDWQKKSDGKYVGSCQSLCPTRTGVGGWGGGEGGRKEGRKLFFNTQSTMTITSRQMGKKEEEAEEEEEEKVDVLNSVYHKKLRFRSHAI